MPSICPILLLFFTNIMSENQEIKASDCETLLELEGVGQVKTNIDRKKGIFAERKAIRLFFQVHELKPGDEIGVEKIGMNHFQVTNKL